jgi:hypothetical protein
VVLSRVAPLDLAQHLLDLADREVVVGRSPNDLEAVLRISGRLTEAGGPQRLAHPLGDSHPSSTRGFLDFLQFVAGTSQRRT